MYTIVKLTILLSRQGSQRRIHRKAKGEYPPPEVKRAGEDNLPFPGEAQGGCRLAEKTAVED